MEDPDQLGTGGAPSPGDSPVDGAGDEFAKPGGPTEG